MSRSAYMGERPERARRPRLASGVSRLLREHGRGQSMLEMALGLPVMAMLLLVSGDFGRALYFAIEVNNAARAGVQYGVQSPITAADIPGMERAALNDAANVPSMSATAAQYCECPGGAMTACPPATSCSNLEVYVEVNTSATFHTLVNYPGLPSTVTVSGKALMREQ